MTKPHATRTYAPLQFDALESHRFEDLVRNLLYDFRDWQKIEATGRGGSDGGFDARAFEKALEVEQTDADDDAEEVRIAEGNLWMIQCKREKQLTASGITAIIDDAVKKEQPPNGYVLAAPVNFTKKSYDAFREALVTKGVTEFHLLGRVELEDMLYLPKNDRILFAFFGISLVSKKRSRVSDVRSVVNNKNRLFKALGPGDHHGAINTHVLIRDTNDIHYPDFKQYPDFEKRPRWREYIASLFYPEGVRFDMHEFLAYVDREKKEWDSFQTIDLLYREVRDSDEPNEPDNLRDRVLDFWEHLPLWNQGKEIVDGLIRYPDFDLIDKEGDAKFRMPHLYIEFSKRGPFSAFWHYIKLSGGNDTVGLGEDYKRVQTFPSKFSKHEFGTIHWDKTLPAPEYLVYRMENGSHHTYFDVEGAYDFLKQRDVICLPNVRGKADSKMYAEVMYHERLTASAMFKRGEYLQHETRQQLSRELHPKESINLLQLKRVYDFQLEKHDSPGQNAT